MLGSLKQAGLAVARRGGLFGVASSSTYRNSRVLVLGYHGVSLKDEHKWDPSLYMSAQALRQRLEVIKQNDCTVLGLEEAISRLAEGNLPRRTVVLTFDDGSSDFHSIVWPMLQEFGYPATVYLTTYYVEHPYPSTPGIWSYMLWKAGNVKVNARPILGEDIIFDLCDKAGRATAFERIRSVAQSQNVDAGQRDALSRELAVLLGLDYQQLYEQRILQLMRPGEVQAVARAGASVQMHMHIHISPATREAYISNPEENRRRIANLTQSTPHHFCYPSGAYDRNRVNWLREYGVASATTCDPGLTSSQTDKLLIPRLIDNSLVSEVVFESWIVGLGAVVHKLAAARSKLRS